MVYLRSEKVTLEGKELELGGITLPGARRRAHSPSPKRIQLPSSLTSSIKARPGLRSGDLRVSGLQAAPPATAGPPDGPEDEVLLPRGADRQGRNRTKQYLFTPADEGKVAFEADLRVWQRASTWSMGH